MLQEIAERIKALPLLPQSFHDITIACNQPNASVYELTRVIEKDPMLVANLVRIANSPLYGFHKQIKSVLQVISLFGAATTRSLTADMSIKKLLSVDLAPYNVTPEFFAHISEMQSQLIKQWYSKVDASKVDTLVLSALLQENGKILIADEVMKNNETYQFKSEIQSCINIASVEKVFVGVTSAEISAYIFQQWKFNNTMVEAIRFSDNYESAPEAIRPYALALKIVKTAIPLNAPLSQRSITLALNIIEKEGLDVSLFRESIDAISQHA